MHLAQELRSQRRDSGGLEVRSLGAAAARDSLWISALLHSGAAPKHGE
jgi:hypothetical protein